MTTKRERDDQLLDLDRMDRPGGGEGKEMIKAVLRFRRRDPSAAAHSAVLKSVDPEASEARARKRVRRRRRRRGRAVRFTVGFVSLIIQPSATRPGGSIVLRRAEWIEGGRGGGEAGR